MDQSTAQTPTVSKTRTCSLTISLEIVKRLQYPPLINVSCTIHAHTIPSESIAIVLTTKDKSSRDEAIMAIAEMADEVVEKMGWDIENVTLTSPETLGAA